MLSLPSAALVVSTAFIFFVLNFRKQKSTGKYQECALPPGPRGWPLIGSLLDLPNGEAPWVEFQKWAYVYGDLTFVRVVGIPLLFISSAEVALDLLEKRSAIYSDKPAAVIDYLTGWDFNVGIMPYGPRWRGIRRIFHQYFNKTVVPNHRQKQTYEIHAFLRRCLDQTGKQHDPMNIRLTLASIIVEVVYGFKIQDMNDGYIKAAVESMDALSESRVSGKFWVDFLPWLRYVPSWVPGTAAVRFGAYWRPKIEKMINTPFDAVMHGTNANASMALDLIMKLSEEKDPARRAEEERNARHATAAAYAAGADTTYSIIQTFFCTMAMHPEIQKRAREELDAVVGPDRLPTFEDYESLPYIRAIIMECSRWLPVVPMSVPHRVTRDDYYKGYYIPEGTVVLANSWHILRDPQEYPEPERFNPDRFIKDGNINPDIRDPHTFTFGFGRRVCPGRHLAKDNAFLTIASILHTFDILPSLKEDGSPHDPTPKMTTGSLSYPAPLHYMLQLRSSDAEKLISATAP